MRTSTLTFSIFRITVTVIWPSASIQMDNIAFLYDLTAISSDWGQNSYGAANPSSSKDWQKPLRSYCEDDSLDMIPLAFLTTFFAAGGDPSINLANVKSITRKSRQRTLTVHRHVTVIIILHSLALSLPTVRLSCKRISNIVNRVVRR